jgi:hypothetical protein
VYIWNICIVCQTKIILCRKYQISRWKNNVNEAIIWQAPVGQKKHEYLIPQSSIPKFNVVYEESAHSLNYTLYIHIQAKLSGGLRKHIGVVAIKLMVARNNRQRKWVR